jgi:Protein of unknown function (DUF2971)
MLYQYRSLEEPKQLDYLRDLLREGALRFTKPVEFNDPFDCYPNHLQELPDGGLPLAVADSILMTQQKAISEHHGIACLTPHSSSMLMWSHYGAHHRGVCAGFDEEELRTNAPLNDQGRLAYEGPIKVGYSATRPSDKKIFSTKSPEWKYENEWRLISVLQKGTPSWGPGVWKVPPSAIKELVLGARMDPKIRSCVIELARRERPSLTLKVVVPHMHKYNLVVELLNAQPDVGETAGFTSVPNGGWRKF